MANEEEEAPDNTWRRWIRPGNRSRVALLALGEGEIAEGGVGKLRDK